MNTDINMSPEDHHVRRKKYIDTNIQGRLIVGLLLLEVVLFAIAMWFVYQELQLAIDNSLYRVHKPQADSTPILFNALLTTVPWIIFVNVLLLIGLNQFWSKYIAGIIEPLRIIINRLNIMDLRSLRKDGAEHPVIEHAQSWMQQEQERCKKIRELTQSLPSGIKNSTPDEQKFLSEILKSIRQKLP